jgi:GrpB-like predicted nucleotidyltransferase (UPF0157 family)
MANPESISVELVAHDPRWAGAADLEGKLIAGVLGSTLLTIHHVGSTSITSIAAKPIVDLLPVVSNLEGLDAKRLAIEALGYEWWGQLGLPGRRYCTKTDPASGRRTFQLHCYQEGSSEIVRHLAFRDYLRANPELAREYEREKVRCQALSPNDSHAYTACKSEWIRRVEKQALSAQR